MAYHKKRPRTLYSDAFKKELVEEILNTDRSYRSISRIAKKHKVPISTLNTWVKSEDHNLKSTFRKYPDILRNKILEEYFDSDLSYESRIKIAAKYSMPQSTLYTWIMNFSGEKPPKKNNTFRSVMYSEATKDAILNEYYKSDKSSTTKKSLAKKYNVNISTFHKWIRKYDKNHKIMNQNKVPKYSSNLKNKIIREFYRSNGKLSRKDLITKYNVSRSSLSRWLTSAYKGYPIKFYDETVKTKKRPPIKIKKISFLRKVLNKIKSILSKKY